jgi:competence protein ComFB
MKECLAMVEMNLRNYMENCVADLIDSVLERMDCCTCDICKADITAIALNSLPPKYVVTQKGKLYTKIYALQNQFEVDTISAITKAAVIVSRNPRHDIEGAAGA